MTGSKRLGDGLGTYAQSLDDYGGHDGGVCLAEALGR